MGNIENFVLEHSEESVFSDELAHHGIAGQKWGVQNGPPYPLDSKKHDSVVKKAEAAASSAGSSVKKTIRKIEDNVAKRKEAKEKEKLASEKQKLKTAKIRANAEKVKAERKALEEKEKADKKAAREKKIADRQAAKDEKNDKLKKDIIEKGDLKACAKNRNLFTNEEIAAVVYRNSTLTKLDELANGQNPSSSNDKKSTVDKINNYANKPVGQRVEDAADTISKVANTAKKVVDAGVLGIQMYNTVADIATANGKPMKKIGLAPDKTRTETFEKDGFKYKEIKYLNGDKISTKEYTDKRNKDATDVSKTSDSTYSGSKKQTNSDSTYSWKKQTNSDDVSSKSSRAIDGRPLLTGSTYKNNNGESFEDYGNLANLVNRVSGSYSGYKITNSNRYRKDDIIDTTWTEVANSSENTSLVDSYLGQKALGSVTQYLLEDKKGK